MLGRCVRNLRVGDKSPTLRALVSRLHGCGAWGGLAGDGECGGEDCALLSRGAGRRRERWRGVGAWGEG